MDSINTETLQNVHHGNHVMIRGQEILSVLAGIIVRINNLVEIDVAGLSDGMIINAIVVVGAKQVWS